MFLFSREDKGTGAEEIQMQGAAERDSGIVVISLKLSFILQFSFKSVLFLLVPTLPFGHL